MQNKYSINDLDMSLNIVSKKIKEKFKKIKEKNKENSVQIILFIKEFASLKKDIFENFLWKYAVSLSKFAYNSHKNVRLIKTDNTIEVYKYDCNMTIKKLLFKLTLNIEIDKYFNSKNCCKNVIFKQKLYYEFLQLLLMLFFIISPYKIKKQIIIGNFANFSAFTILNPNIIEKNIVFNENDVKYRKVSNKNIETFTNVYKKSIKNDKNYINNSGNFFKSEIEGTLTENIKNYTKKSFSSLSIDPKKLSNLSYFNTNSKIKFIHFFGLKNKINPIFLIKVLKVFYSVYNIKINPDYITSNSNTTNPLLDFKNYEKIKFNINTSTKRKYTNKKISEKINKLKNNRTRKKRKNIQMYLNILEKYITIFENCYFSSYAKGAKMIERTIRENHRNRKSKSITKNDKSKKIKNIFDHIDDNKVKLLINNKIDILFNYIFESEQENTNYNLSNKLTHLGISKDETILEKNFNKMNKNIKCKNKIVDNIRNKIKSKNLFENSDKLIEAEPSIENIKNIENISKADSSNSNALKKNSLRKKVFGVNKELKQQVITNKMNVFYDYGTTNPFTLSKYGKMYIEIINYYKSSQDFPFDINNFKEIYHNNKISIKNNTNILSDKFVEVLKAFLMYFKDI